MSQDVICSKCGVPIRDGFCGLRCDGRAEGITVSTDLHDQWISFCKRAAPGTRYWLDDELFDRLFDRIGQEARFCSEPPAWKTAIEFRGGYQHGGLTFYPRKSYPHPIRRCTDRQFPGQQEFHAR